MIMRRPASPPLGLPAARTAPAKSRSGRFFLVGWVIYLVVSPFYVFKSGLPQPADALMALMISILATGYALRVPIHNDLYLAGAAFLSWVTVANLFWWGQYQDPMFLLSSAYYVYDFCILVLVFSLFQRLREDFFVATRLALIVAVVVQLVCLLVLPDVLKGFRATGTFNNPNQLGYWSLLVTACYVVTRGEASLKWLDVLMLCALAYIAALSLSKAAMLSILAMLGFALWFQGVSSRLKLAVVTAIAFGTAVVLAQPGLLQVGLGDGLSSRVVERFDDIGNQKDDSLTARGYDRIWLFPEYLLVGAGEGAYERFRTGISTEMHSTFGTILFSYGLPGAALFLLVLWIIFRRAPPRYLVYFVPVCLYGITHQGLRFTQFWIFLALVFCSAQYGAKPPASPPRPAPEFEKPRLQA
jgi:hypothetical protein